MDSGCGCFRGRVQMDGDGGGLLCVGAMLQSAGVSGGGDSLIAVDLSWLVGSCVGAVVCW